MHQKLFSIIIKYQKYIVFFAVILFVTTLLFTVHAPTDIYWYEFWWMFPVAIVIAVTVNTLGLSGAALFVPFFVLLFPYFAEPLSASQSVTLGLITESFGLSSSALAFISFGLVDFKLAFQSIISAIGFVAVGSFVAIIVPQSILFLMISGLLIISVLLVYYKNHLHKQRHDESNLNTIDYVQPEGELVEIISTDNRIYKYCHTKKGIIKRTFGYGIGGFFQGSAGFGIGEIGIISMIISKIPTRIAIGTSHIIVATTAIFASVLHLSFNAGFGAETIPWNIPIMTVPAVVLGGQIAPYVAAKLRTKTLEKFVSTIFIIIALSLSIIALRTI